MVVDSLFIIAPDVCGFFVFGPCLCNAVLNVLSSFSLTKRAMVALHLLCSYCLVRVHESMLYYICVFPHSAVGWSMVCDCGISSVSWPNSHLLFRVVSDVIPRYFID